MKIKWFLFILISVHFSTLAKGEEKLIVMPALAGDIPEDVRNATQALGLMSEKTGFFVNSELFAAPITVKTGKGPFPFHAHILLQFREVTEEEVEMTTHLQEGEIVAVTAGQAKIEKGYVANGGDGWGIFKVDKADETELWTAKIEKFLKFSEFQEGDRIFLLSSYYSKTEDLKDNSRRSLILKIANPQIENIDAGIDWEQSSLSERMRAEINNTVAVNQRGEVIGFLKFKNETDKMVQVAPNLKDFFSKSEQKILQFKKKINGNHYPLGRKAMRISAANAGAQRLEEDCPSSFNSSKKIIPLNL